MGYYYYGTKMVMTENLYKEFIKKIDDGTYALPYIVSRTLNGHYILEWDEIKRYYNLVSLADAIINDHDDEPGYGYRLLTEGESNSDFIMEEGFSSYDTDEDNIYEFEDFYWEKHEPDEFYTAIKVLDWRN